MSPDKAKKRFGQHFLVSSAVVQKIIDLADARAGEVIVEIGPGRGALTFPLAASGAGIVAVELERAAFAWLQEELGDRSNLTLINRDFLTLTPSELGVGRFKLIGNLPYNISSPVIDWAVRYRDRITVAVFMIQKEVARRLSSSPKSKDWSPLAIFTQLAFDIDYCFEVPPRSFQPPPKVFSAVVRLVPRALSPIDHYQLFEKVVRASFHQRRKLLINNLVPQILPDSRAARDFLSSLGFSEKARAEELSTEEFLTLTAALIKHNMIA